MVAMPTPPRASGPRPPTSLVSTRPSAVSPSIPRAIGQARLVSSRIVDDRLSPSASRIGGVGDRWKRALTTPIQRSTSPFCRVPVLGRRRRPPALPEGTRWPVATSRFNRFDRFIRRISSPLEPLYLVTPGVSGLLRGETTTWLALRLDDVLDPTSAHGAATHGRLHGVRGRGEEGAKHQGHQDATMTGESQVVKDER